MLHDVLLLVHITTGVLGLLVGPVSMRAPKRRGLHTRSGVAYQVLVAGMTWSALGLWAYDPARLWVLALIAVATQAAAAAGWVVRRRARPGWLPVHVQLMAGSYISFVTAALMTNWDSPLAAVLPTVVGSPLIGLTVFRLKSAEHARRARQGERESGGAVAAVGGGV